MYCPKCCVLPCHKQADCVVVDWPLLMLDLTSIKEMVPMHVCKTTLAAAAMVPPVLGAQDVQVQLKSSILVDAYSFPLLIMYCHAIAGHNA